MKKNKYIIFVVALVIISFIMITAATIMHYNDKKIEESFLYTKDIKYVIKKNETLEDVAIKFNLFEDKLLGLNNMTRAEFKPGKKITIPNVTYRKIIPNEPLKNIAFEFNISMNTIKKANNLDSDDISKRKYLMIPNTLVYVADKDIKYSEIANKFNVSLDKLIEYNFLEGDTLKNGHFILIPKKSCAKVIDGEFYTKEDEIGIMYLNSLAKTLYESGDYKKLSHCDKGYYLIAGQSKFVDSEIYDYLIRCPHIGVIIKFDFPDTKNVKNKHYSIRHKFQQNLDEIGEDYLNS